MRIVTLACLTAAAFATLQDSAFARRWDFPNSGICPNNYLRVTNLRACALFDHAGHRIPGAKWVPIAEFKQYGISRMRVP
jgi:hypothetical protein